MLNQFERGLHCKKEVHSFIKNAVVYLCLVTANVDVTRGLEPCPGIKILLKITKRPVFSGTGLTVNPVYLCTLINISF